MTKIWIDVSGIEQSHLLSTFAKLISPTADVMITTSNDPRPEKILRFSSLSPKTVRSAGGDKLQRYADRILTLTSEVERFKPDLLISDLDSAAVRTAFGLGVPCWTIFTNKPENSHNGDDIDRMSYPLCEKVFASRFFGKEKLMEQGIPPSRIVEFNGFNECYLKFAFRRKASYPRILLRPNGHDHLRWLEEVARRLLRIRNARITILCKPNLRTRDWNLDPARIRFLDFTPYPPVIDQDLFVGWGRMLAESFVLGVPSIRTIDEVHPDLSMIYSQQPTITDPNKIARTSRRMLGKNHGRGRIARLESPVNSLLSNLREEGFFQ